MECQKIRLHDQELEYPVNLLESELKKGYIVKLKDGSYRYTKKLLRREIRWARHLFRYRDNTLYAWLCDVFPFIPKLYIGD